MITRFINTPGLRTMIVWVLSNLIFTTLLAQGNYPEKEEPDSLNSKLQPIAITNINAEADKLNQKLSKIEKDLQTPIEITLIDSLTVFQIDFLENERKRLTTDKLLKLSKKVNEDLRRRWDNYLSQLKDWVSVLNLRSKKLSEYYNQVNSYSIIWKKTRDKVDDPIINEEIIERIDSQLMDIDSIQDKISIKIGVLIKKENAITDEIIAIKQLIEKIDISQQQQLQNILRKDSPFIWKISRDKTSEKSYSILLKENLQENLESFTAFFRVNKDRPYWHLFLIVSLISLFLWIRINSEKLGIKSHIQPGSNTSQALDRPVGSALLLALMLGIMIYPNRPLYITELFLIIVFIPVIRVIPKMVNPALKGLIYIIPFLYVLDQIQITFWNQELIHRIYLFVYTILLLLITMWVLRPAGSINKIELRWMGRLVLKFTYIGSILLIISVIANIFGRVALAGLITRLFIEGTALALILYSTFVVIKEWIFILLRINYFNKIKLVIKYQEVIEKRITTIMAFMMFIIWVKGILVMIGVYRPFYEWISNVLTKKWEIGTTDISIGGILSFFLILIITFLLARLFKVLVEEEIIGKEKLRKGIAIGISVLFRYFIIVFGVILAMSAIGIDLNKFSLIAGAMGVGIGFGLQGIILNFISGIILLFERPVHVGDTIEVGPLLGKVKKIGVRSSSIETYDGAEVIVPNGDLVSKEVINWTLTDEQKRRELIVRTVYGTDPHKVLDILYKVALEHPMTIKDPKPIALFQGYGEYSLDFKLLYWVHISSSFTTGSELTLGIHDALREAGVEIAMPQQTTFIKTDKQDTNEKV